MCGIVGLYLKNDKYKDKLGELFEPMLIAMTDRGPDSAGFAVYGDEVGEGWVKLTVRGMDEACDWAEISDTLSSKLNCKVEWTNNADVAVLKINGDEKAARELMSELYPDVLILSAGSSIEILKEVGLPEKILSKYNVRNMKGTHIIGHTRMATESAVTMEGSHPFSTGSDLCLVHNGSLSNHNRLREKLKREGIVFQTENDSEVAAGYLAWRLEKCDTIKEALESALKDLDGFFTFTIGTKDGFAVMRDPIACKPAVLAETEDYVAMASEYQALTTLPGIENAKVWEPDAATFYIWERK
jgi:glutamate synthase domain-containing protein 1